MEDVKYNRKKENINSPRNDHDENSDHDGGEEKYDTKVTSSSGKLFNLCIFSLHGNVC